MGVKMIVLDKAFISKSYTEKIKMINSSEKITFFLANSQNTLYKKGYCM